MQELSIPQEHYNKFKFYVTLPKELKQKIWEQMNIAPMGLSPSALVDFVSNNIPNLSKERISDIFNIYFNLIRTKESINLAMPEFLEMLGASLAKMEIDELSPTTEVLNDFEQMLQNSNNALITSKVIDLMTENQKTFINAKMYQDIRPLYDEDDNLLVSAIVHNLKITHKENDEIKEIYFSLDDNDLEELIVLLKKNQDKLKIIKSHFENAKILEIK